jgi:predicted HD phosphohydrolase
MNSTIKQFNVVAITVYLDDADRRAINEVYNKGKIGFLTPLGEFKTKNLRNYLIAYRHATSTGDTFWARIDDKNKSRVVTFEITS